MMPAEMFPQLDAAETPEQMRLAIDRHGYHSPLVHSVITVAVRDTLSNADLYTMLAYHALRALVDSNRRCFELMAQRAPDSIDVRHVK